MLRVKIVWPAPAAKHAEANIITVVPWQRLEIVCKKRIKVIKKKQLKIVVNWLMSRKLKSSKRDLCLQRLKLPVVCCSTSFSTRQRYSEFISIHSSSLRQELSVVIEWVAPENFHSRNTNLQRLSRQRKPESHWRVVLQYITSMLKDEMKHCKQGRRSQLII